MTVLLFLAAAVLAACGGKDDVTEPDKSSVTEDTAANTAADAAEEDRLPLGISEDLRFEGESFTFLGVDTGLHFGYYSTTDLWAESENAEPLNDAVFQRNRAVEDRFGIQIGTVDFDDPVPEITKIVEANDCIYDAVWANGNAMYSLAAKGYFMDFNSMPNLNLQNPWWDQNILKDYSFYGKNYIVTGHISTRDDACTLFVYFNKKMLADYNLESPYRMVEEGTWTFTRFSEMVKAISVDVNGDGKMTDGDCFGLIGENGLVNRFYTSMGGTFYSCTDEGTYRITVSDERNLDIYDALYTLLLDDQSVAHIEGWSNKGADGNVYGYARSLFTQDRFLFHIAGPLIINEFRDMESDFGIIPVPKFDMSEERYYAVVDEHAPFLAVTVNAPDPEKTGALLEAMAWESMYTLTPVYNETLLKRKYTRDDESASMLEIIAESRVYNIMAMTDWGGLYGIASQKYHAGKAIAVSDFEKKMKTAEKAMEKDLAYFADLSG